MPTPGRAKRKLRPQPAPERTLAHWVTRILVDARKRAGVDIKDVARHARVEPSTIWRLESGKHPLPPQIDSYWAGYARALGDNIDPRAFAAAAVELWIGEGLPPVVVRKDEEDEEELPGPDAVAGLMDAFERLRPEAEPQVQRHRRAR